MAHEMIGTHIVTERLVALLESGTEKVLLIDSRPFVEYNTSHILEAININCSKLMKRRLQQDKVLITELIQHSAKHKVDVDCSQKVVVYDQSSQDVASLASDCFLTVLLGKLEKSFSSVHLLAGTETSIWFPEEAQPILNAQSAPLIALPGSMQTSDLAQAVLEARQGSRALVRPRICYLLHKSLCKHTVQFHTFVHSHLLFSLPERPTLVPHLENAFLILWYT
ncbi:MAPK phosphatase 7 [Pontoporia blainvillei]|uniref:MAPK phosphatase 7 n=1 Tax=Pontoporia blainvillei TaxID=48723 RepID=A0ABX0S794_PONBL|nr:MAPK phosphatase 7 [Pontoporia blainvillei]